MKKKKRELGRKSSTKVSYQIRLLHPTHWSTSTDNQVISSIFFMESLTAPKTPVIAAAARAGGQIRKQPSLVRARTGGSARARMMMGKYKGTQMREKQLTEMIEKKVKEAEEVCGEDGRSDECKVAWDEVEEVSQAKADLRLKLEIMHQDPLESFCQDNPETDECRIYED